jgi:hypothetical protein
MLEHIPIMVSNEENLDLNHSIYEEMFFAAI